MSALLIRYAVPVLLAVAGIIGIIVGHAKYAAAGAGVVLLGGSLMIWLIGYLIRLSVSSNADRDRDEEARDYFSAHGYWPGEGPASGKPKAPGERNGAGGS